MRASALSYPLALRGENVSWRMASRTLRRRAEPAYPSLMNFLVPLGTATDLFRQFVAAAGVVVRGMQRLTDGWGSQSRGDDAWRAPSARMGGGRESEKDGLRGAREALLLRALGARVPPEVIPTLDLHELEVRCFSAEGSSIHSCASGQRRGKSVSCSLVLDNVAKLFNPFTRNLYEALEGSILVRVE